MTLCTLACLASPAGALAVDLRRPLAELLAQAKGGSGMGVVSTGAMVTVRPSDVRFKAEEVRRRGLLRSLITRSLTNDRAT